MRLVVVLALVAGCGDNLPDPGTPHSGSRLKVGWYVYPGGARERETSWYYDAILHERCVTQMWSDGHRYCSPLADEAVYVTESCTRALGRTHVSESPAPFFATQFQLAGEPIPVRSRLFRRGESTLAPTSIWINSTGGCRGPFEPGDNLNYFELGEEIVTADLPRVLRSDPHGDGELAVIDDRSDDGLRVPLMLFDNGAASECATANPPNATSVECVPVGTATAAYFHDAGCSEPVVGAPLDTTPTIAARSIVETSCTEYYRVAIEIAVPPLYEHNPSGCIESTALGGQRFFAMAERIQLPVLERVRDTTTARVQSITRLAGELRIADPWMYDAVLGTDCAHDAELRCVPKTLDHAEVARGSYFADPTCTTVIDLAFVPQGSCDPPARFVGDGDGYYPLAAPYQGMIYVPSTGDTCSGFAPAAPFVAYTIGPRIEPATFARAALVIDP